MTKENKYTSMLRVLIAGGGTGGHIFSGTAIADEILRRRPDSKILFVGTKYGLEKNLVPHLSYQFKTITVRGLKGKNPLQTLRNLILLPLSIFQSRRHIKDFKPDIVFGVGGYASGPVCLVSAKRGIPTVIIEQNSIPGMTNRLLSKYVDFAAIAYKSAEKSLKCKCYLTGVPLRAEIYAFNRKINKRDHFTVLVLGGSQGAHAINQTVVEALPLINESKLKIGFIHQTGEKDYQYVKSAYDKYGLKAEIYKFINDMLSAYGRTSLVVSRAGAITVAEIKRLGLASILVPLAGSIYNHQYYNARELSSQGAAILIDQDKFAPALFYETLKKLLDKSELEKIIRRLAPYVTGNSTREIVDKSIELLKDNELQAGRL